MFKQPQELQKRQQLQDLGDQRNQNYINHLPSLKQSSPSINGMPIFEPTQMHFPGNMHMMQHGGSAVFQGLPNRLIHSHSQSHGLNPDGTLYPQFDASYVASPTPSSSLLCKGSNSSFGMTALQASSSGDYMNQQCEFSLDEISVPDGSLFYSSQEKNIFEQRFDAGILHNYHEQENADPGISFSLESQGQHDNSSWNEHERSREKSSNLDLSSLDLLEEDTCYTDALPSMQSGSWSSMMQSALAETSSSDTAVQEEWSGLSFQNPELSSEYQHSNLLDNEHFQHLRRQEDFNSESSHASTPHSHVYLRQLADYSSQLKNLTGANQVIQASLPSLNILPDHPKEHLENDKHLIRISSCTEDIHVNSNLSVQDLKDVSWLHGSKCSQNPLDQSNSKISVLKEFSPTKTTTATSVQPCSTSPALNDFGFGLRTTDPWTLPQSYSFSESLPMGNTSSTTSSHYTSTHLKSKHSTPPVPIHVMKLQEYSTFTSQENSYAQINSASCPEFPLSDNIVPGTSITLSRFPSGPPSPWLDMTGQQTLTSPKTCNLSSNLLKSPDTVSSSLEIRAGASSDHLNQMYCKHEYNYNETIMCSGKSEMNNSTSLSRSTCEEEILGNHYFETDDGASNLLGYDQACHRDSKTPDVLPRDVIAFDHGRNQIKSSSSGHKPGVTYKTKGGLNDVSQLGAFSTGDNKGQNMGQEVQGHHSGMGYYPSSHQIRMFGQNPTQSHDPANNEASNMTHGSQISLQMAPTWFKHYGTSKNEQVLPICNQNDALNDGKQFIGRTHHNLQEYNMIRQGSSTEPSQGAGFQASEAATMTVSKQLSLPRILPSDSAHESMPLSVPKKRKSWPFDVVPWHKEVNPEPSSIQNISVSCTAEIQWAQALNVRVEIKNVAETVEDLPPVRAKRRLTFTTQLMQELFGPAPAAFLSEDKSSNYDCFVYTSTRLALGDACRLTGQLLPSNAKSPEIQSTWKRIIPSDWLKAVEGLKSRVDKLECDLSRMDETLSVANIKLENQELEKTFIINRFAKLYIRNQSSTIHPETSSSVSVILKLNPQRYVTALPLPRTVPEGTDCLHL